MIPEEIINNFESKDPHKMWEATWEVLRCNEQQKLKKLMPHLEKLRALCNVVKMGGAFRSNNQSAELAFLYIENIYNCICRCQLYPTQSILEPRREEELGFIKILKSELFRELFEEHYWVVCNSCGEKLNVREVEGGHAPWYEWKNAL